jgi:hypothetical protein
VLKLIYIQATPACILFCNPYATHQQPKSVCPLSVGQND